MSGNGARDVNDLLGVMHPVVPDINTVEDWNQYVSGRNTYQPPILIDHDEYRRFDPRDRMKYDIVRRHAAANLPHLDTPSTFSVSEEITSLLMVNVLNGEPGVRPGAMISALGGRGKSTLLRGIAAEFQVALQAVDDLGIPMIGTRNQWVPVAWVRIPPKATVIGVCKRILNYYGQPYKSRDPESTLLDLVGKVISGCGTKLIVLDDITRLRTFRLADQDVLDFIRDLQDFGGTIVAAGVAIERSNIVTEGNRQQSVALSQTSNRFNLYNLDDFRLDSPEGRKAWNTFLAGLEQHLPLLNPEPRFLVGQSDYIFDRTRGMVAAVAQLISRSAMGVIGRSPAKGGETITHQDLERVTLSASLQTLVVTDDEDLDEPVRTGRTRRRRSPGNQVFTRDRSRPSSSPEPQARAQHNQASA